VISQIVQDLRHATRMIRKRPGVAAVVVLSVGIGIGVNTAVFTWIQARILQPLPGVTESNRLLQIEPRGESGSYPGMSWLEYRDLQQRLPAFHDVFAVRMVPLNVGAAGQIERAFAFLVSGNYFSTLGLQPALGRFLRPEEAVPGGDPVIVISHEFWQTRFGGSPGVLGQTMQVNERAFTIVGIAPRGFRGTIMGLNFDLWVPATLAPLLLDGSRELELRGMRAYSAIGRLQPGATRAEAQAQLDAAMRDLAQAYPDTNQNIRAEVLAIWDSPRGPNRFITSGIALLQAVTLLVLVAVCGNAANLLLARASTRRQEVSVRLAMGAGRWRILSLLMTEHLLMGLMGAVLGALVAVWGSEALRAVPMPSPAGITIRFETHVDAVTLIFATALGVLSGVAFGLAPALQLARLEPLRALRAGMSPAGRSRVRDVLMAVQVALALVALVVAALFVRSYNDTQRTDPGFRREGVLLAAYDLRSRNRGADNATAADFARRVLARLQALPNVESAALATSVPLDIHGLPSRAVVVEGRARSDGLLDQVLTNTVSPGYFATMKIPFVAGADFVVLDDVATAPQAIVNEEFVNRYIGQAAAIGRRIETGGRPYVVAGVVKDSLANAFGEPPTAIIYLSLRDRPNTSAEIHVRTRDGHEAELAPAIRKAVQELDASLPIYNVRTMVDHVDQNLVFRKIPARMFAVLGPLLLGLAAMGIYAVVAYSVSQRRPEIGMRLALGASARRVVIQLIAETLTVIAIGAFAGWLVALMISWDAVRAGGMDMVIYAGVPIILLAVATAACWLPARRASRIDPLKALRQE
jgi:putative ABC transport system permease protein